MLDHDPPGTDPDPKYEIFRFRKILPPSPYSPVTYSKPSSISSVASFTFTATLLLNLEYNQIVDITALSGLTWLVNLYLFNNQIVDIDPLSELTNLHDLRLEYNHIEDINPLLDCLDDAYSTVIIHNNPLDETAPDIIAELRLRGITVLD